MPSLPGEFSGLFTINFFLLISLSSNLFLVIVVGNIQFDFGTLTLSSLKLLGDAHLNNGSVILTRDIPVPNSGAGRALYSKPIRFRQPGVHNPASFSTFFSFSVKNLNPSSIGGGIAFVISPDDESVGDAGGYLGVMNQKGSPNGVVAVEFDTLMDVEFSDINGNHVGLDLNSMVSAHVGDLETIAVDLKSGDLVNSWIDYSGSTRVFNISVSYSTLKPNDPLLSFVLDLDQYVAGDLMFVGFSGSTQGSTESHTIKWWNFSSSLDINLKSDPSPLSPSSSPPPAAATTNPTFNSANPPPPSPPPSESNNSTLYSPKINRKCHNQMCKERPGAVVGIVTAGAFVLALFTIFLIWVHHKKFKHLKNPDHSLTSEIMKTPREFSYKELKSATKCFSSTRIIGRGAFGTVYKGILQENGEIVAVKRCSHGGGEGKAEFLSELSIIGSLRHRNLVRLRGWCREKGEILLVYDLMHNGSLDKALFESGTPPPWPLRRRILVGVASALAYLHHECENQVIHRDVKTSNIMLDEGFNARLGDFGLAREIDHEDSSPAATAAAAGTMGYFAPEYLLTGRACEKTDVFSYGAVVLEVATGRRPIEKVSIAAPAGGCSGGSCQNLVEWVWSLHEEGCLVAAADSRLGGEFDESEVMRVLLVGLACAHPDPVARPTMRVVVQMLVGEGGDSEVPIVPRKKPSMGLISTSSLLLNLQDSVSDLNGVITISTSSSDDGFNGGVELV
ncbi:L-type lectin-domain containing receptor kinase VIII.1 [Sarracenia purpurea var. burkii]